MSGRAAVTNAEISQWLTVKTEEGEWAGSVLRDATLQDFYPPLPAPLSPQHPARVTHRRELRLPSRGASRRSLLKPNKNYRHQGRRGGFSSAIFSYSFETIQISKIKSACILLYLMSNLNFFTCIPTCGAK